MSGSERDRAALVRRCAEEGLSQSVAAARLGIGVRPVKRLVRRWRDAGDAGLVSRQRGCPSNNRLPDDRRARIAALLAGTYEEFGPTLAAEKLAAIEGIAVSAETVRAMQIKLGLWRPKRRRAGRLFQLRERRPRFGELIQIDGSPHAWFEGRGPRCTLIVFIDDATSRLTAVRFAPAETTRAYLEALRAQVLGHGPPLALSSDRHGIFRVNAKEAASGDGKTEFGRVAARLDIASIQALTPQAKGRVERANQTLQDRLVKEMRLAGVSSIEAGNAFLPGFVDWWNTNLAVAPRDAADAHRPWADTPDALDDGLARREDRRLSKALTFSAGGTIYCVRTKGPGTARRGAKVELRHRPGGTMTVHYKDRILPVTACRTCPTPDPAEDERPSISASTLSSPPAAPTLRLRWRPGVDNAGSLRRCARALACVTHPRRPRKRHSNLGQQGDIPTLR